MCNNLLSKKCVTVMKTNDRTLLAARLGFNSNRYRLSGKRLVTRIMHRLIYRMRHSNIIRDVQSFILVDRQTSGTLKYTFVGKVKMSTSSTAHVELSEQDYRKLISKALTKVSIDSRSDGQRFNLSLCAEGTSHDILC